MNKYKPIFLIALINLVLSLLVVYINPRFDFLTLLLFILTNGIVAFLLIKREKKKEKDLEEKIDQIFNLLHSLDTDSETYEVEDNIFGKLRDEIIKIILENKRMARMAENNNQILREYTEDIAHQIKTPLTGALLMLDLIDSDKANTEEYSQWLRDNITRLYELSDILLKLAALDSGTVEMKRESLSARALVQDLGENIEKTLGLTRQVPIYGDDFSITCDKRWTYEAIFNIVKNGLEASGDQGVEIFLEENKLYSSIFVRDFGPWMTKDQLERAFKRFHKEDPDSEGYGIGLPMAKAIMEKQGGDLLYTRNKDFNSFELRFYK